MNLDYLRSYLEVVKRGSFSDAAKALGLSQPTISFQIQRLETDLGLRLLERRGGKIIMTPAGQEFHRFAERVMAEQERLIERIGAFQEKVSGRLVLGASTIPGEYLLPRLVAEFSKLHPTVSAYLTVSDTADVVDKVANRECDIGFVGAAPPKHDLKYSKLADDELVLIVYPDHPFAAKPSVKITELNGEPIVQREEGSGTRRSIEQLLRSAGFDIERQPFSLVVGSSQAVISGVEAGAGIGFVSRLAAAKSLELDKVRAVPIEGVQLRRSIFYVYNEKHITTRLLREFRSFLEEWSSKT